MDQISLTDKLVLRYIRIAAFSAAFVALTWAGVISLVVVMNVISMFRDDSDAIRQTHLQQHADEQVKYDEMIRLLGEIQEELESGKSIGNR